MHIYLVMFYFNYIPIIDKSIIIKNEIILKKLFCIQIYIVQNK